MVCACSVETNSSALVSQWREVVQNACVLSFTRPGDFFNQSSSKTHEQDLRWKMAGNLERFTEESSEAEAVEEGEGSEGRRSAFFPTWDRREGGFDHYNNQMVIAVAF